MILLASTAFPPSHLCCCSLHFFSCLMFLNVRSRAAACAHIYTVHLYLSALQLLYTPALPREGNQSNTFSTGGFVCCRGLYGSIIAKHTDRERRYASYPSLVRPSETLLECNIAKIVLNQAELRAHTPPYQVSALHHKCGSHAHRVEVRSRGAKLASLPPPAEEG